MEERIRIRSGVGFGIMTTVDSGYITPCKLQATVTRTKRPGAAADGYDKDRQASGDLGPVR